MSDRPVEDQLWDRIADTVFEYLTEKLQSSSSDYRIDGIKPELLFTRDPDVYPLIVDLGDDRFMVEVDVMVSKIDKGGSLDLSCSEEEAYGIAGGGGPA